MLPGGGEGVVAVVHEGHGRGGGRLAVGGVGDFGLDVVPEIVQGGHTVDPRPPFPCHGGSWGVVGWVLGHVRLAAAGAACGSYPLLLGVSNKLLPPVDGQHPDAVSFGGWGVFVSGSVDEGIEEEISDAFAQGGRLDALPCAGGVGLQHLLVPIHRLDGLPYCREVVDGKGGGWLRRCGSWW